MQSGCKRLQSKNRAKTRKNGHSWASQYQTWVGRASIERGLADQYQAPSGLGGPVSSPTRGVSKSLKKTYGGSTSFLTADDSAKKTGKIFTLFDAGAVPTRRRLPGLGTVPARETFRWLAFCSFLTVWACFDLSAHFLHDFACF